MIQGIGTADGIGIGKAVIIEQKEIYVEKSLIANIEGEKRQFLSAKTIFEKHILQAGERAKKLVGVEEAEIILAQNVMINDPELEKETFSMIENDMVNVEYAFSTVIDNYIMIFESMDDELLNARASDFKDIKSRLLSILLGIEQIDLSTVGKNSILIAQDITPSQASSIDKDNIMGIAIETGTEFSHIAILSKSLEIPSIVGAGELIGSIKNGDTIIVDGGTGEIYINPDEKTLKEFNKKKEEIIALKKSLEIYKNKPTLTQDGIPIELAANLAMVLELPTLVSYNVDGIGLFRTEFLYMENKRIPSEEEQFLVYKKITQSMGNKPVIIRTLDVGGDKEIDYLELKKEENPFLGFRGIRFSLEKQELFKDQLRALLRASAFGNIFIMIPMVISSEEIIETRTILESLKVELSEQNINFNNDIPLGIMVETPSAALIADQLAEYSDFFSIGTNDLTQYTLAVDRTNKKVAQLYDIFHPAVLRGIYNTIQAANNKNIMVGICGQAGADENMVPFLIGCGIDEISVPSGDLLRIKKIISNTSKAVWEKHVKNILTLRDSKEVLKYIKMYR